MVYQAGSPEVNVEEGVSFVDCQAAKQFKPFYMMFSEYWVEVQPEEYIWDANGDSSLCIILLMPNTYDYFLLGQPLF
jgi:hypothetical protein